MFLADVPIGQPHFLIYRYSPLPVLRLESALVGVVIGAGAIAFLRWGLARASESPSVHAPSRLRFGLHTSSLWVPGLFIAGAVVCYVGLVVWTFFAPPGYVEQHSFNLLSPSHDGAFVLEGRQVESIREYVSETFYHNLQKEPEDMRGRRVLSNPPGVTVASILVHRLVQALPVLQTWCINAFGLDELEDPEQQVEFAAAFMLAMVFTVAWGGSFVFAYRLCRLWMPIPASTAVAFACVFNPSTVNFTPGKDPAQMFTVLAILLCWLTAYSRGGVACPRSRLQIPGLPKRLDASVGMAPAAGAVLACSTMLGLVHMWVFAIVAAATLWHAVTRGAGFHFWLLRCALPALGGGLCVAAFAFVTLDWDLMRTALRVGIRYGQIQVDVITDPFYWTLVGLPMFLLFVGPLFWVELTALRRETADTTSSLGRCMLVCTIVAMLYTYLFANNSETPRLWMPFIPLLLVGMGLRRSVFRANTVRQRRLCLVLIALQCSVTILHWSMMDVRESEYRLTSGRMWD
jgi:hypothetical protein